MLHYGHLKHLEAAKKYGDRLIVSITADVYVSKGPGRPYFTAERRAGMVASIKGVDDVYVCNSNSAIPAIEHFKPDFYVKGEDYKDPSKDPTGEILNEKAAVESYGGKLVFTNEEVHSSSTLINRFFQGWAEDQKQTIEKVNSLGGMASIENALNEVAKLRVLVVGEPILDVYRFVTPEGISSKSPSLSARFVSEEEYYGGSWAIYNHLLGFTRDFEIVLPNKPCKKIRYISGTQRIFEVTEIDEDIKNREFLADKMLEESHKSDVVVLADFGHGLFEGEVLEACKEIKAFTGLNVQTNSSNFGFNLFQRHQRFDYLCLDTREARLSTQDRYGHPLSVAHKIKEVVQRPFGFTAGPQGAYLMYGAQTYYSPTFSDVVVDATGAGDAYFAITTCLLASGCSLDLVPFIGNVFAGLKCKIIGNKASVSKASLLKACKAILS